MAKDIRQSEEPDDEMTLIAGAGLNAALETAKGLGRDLDDLGVLVCCVADQKAQESVAGIGAHIDTAIDGLELALGAAQSIAETAGVGIQLMRVPKAAAMGDSADSN